MGGQPAARFDAFGITETIKRALASAGLDPHAGTMKGVTNIIEQALSTAGLMQRRDTPDGRGVTIDSTAREIHAEPENPVAIQRQAIARDEIVVEPRASDIPARRRGEFLERSFASVNGARLYKVYVPAQYSVASTERVPMVVMLHGCTQSPDDFANGTRMNALADEHGFIVVYPAQSANANVQKCWNWFRTQDQVRESGEPAIIAGITRDVASTYRIDERRIFVAGMSAGAAMAVSWAQHIRTCMPRSARTRGWLTAPPTTCRPRSAPCAEEAGFRERRRKQRSRFPPSCSMETAITPWTPAMQRPSWSRLPQGTITRRCGWTPGPARRRRTNL